MVGQVQSKKWKVTEGKQSWYSNKRKKGEKKEKKTKKKKYQKFSCLHWLKKVQLLYINIIHYLQEQNFPEELLDTVFLYLLHLASDISSLAHVFKNT